MRKYRVRYQVVMTFEKYLEAQDKHEIRKFVNNVFDGAVHKTKRGAMIKDESMPSIIYVYEER